MSIYVKGSGKKKKYVAKGSIPLGGGAYKYYERVMKGASSKQEAIAMELDFKRRFNFESSLTSNRSFTLQEFIQYYNDAKKNSIKSSTKQSNQYISKFFTPLFDRKITSISSNDIKNVLDKKFNEGLSEGYVNKGLEYANKVFSYAVKQGFITYNPVQKISHYKRPDQQKNDPVVYTPEQFSRFISCFPKDKNNGTDDYPCYVIANVLFLCGLRIGECLALTKEDIDLNNNTLRINKTVFRNVEGHSYLVTPPKTRNSIRTILIPKTLKQILSEYLEWFDHLYGTNEKCFLFGIDQPIHPKTVRKRFKKAADKAGLPIIKLHGARHSAASWMMNSGMPAVAVANRLGHTVSELTRTYTHLFNQSEKALVDSIDSVFEKLDSNKTN